MRIHTDDDGRYVNAISASCGVDVNGQLYYLQAGSDSTVLYFQRGAVGKHGVNGLTNEALLNVLVHRLGVLDQKAPCQENKDALAGCQMALSLLQARELRVAVEAA